MAARAARAEAPYGELVRQYLDLRDQNPGVLLLFRVGSFYEVLFEDAELVGRELGLKLGDRPSGGSAPPVPQCGFAHHALDTFLPRLLSRGYRVAVCEEEAPPERGEPGAAGAAGASGGPGAAGGAEGVRRRAVVRTLTPGTVTDPGLLREDRPTFLAAVVAGEEGRIGLAWTDVAAGEFRAGEFDLEGAAAELQRLDPAEVLVPADFPSPEALTARRPVTPVGPAGGEGAAGGGSPGGAIGRLRRAFPGAPLGDLPLAQVAAGVVVTYLETTQGEQTPPLERPQAAGAGDSLRLDAATQRHLELVETEHGRTRQGSLLATIDRAVTPMGQRMLRGWLQRPLTSLSKIGVRQRIVAELVADGARRTALAECLGAFADLERLAGRAAAHRATADDLRAMAAAGGALPGLARAAGGAQTPFLRALGNARPGLTGFAARARAVLPEPGEAEVAGAGPVRPDASPALAAALARLGAARDWQAQYVEGLRRRRTLGRVKLERTSTQGLFLEVPANTEVPPDWVRRGGLQKVERYTTPDLEAHAVELAAAEALAAAETRAVLEALRTAAAAVAGEARDLARNLAASDALLSLALVAVERGWVRPEVDEGDEIVVEGGRHPVVETQVGQGAFQPNDARLQARGLRDQVVVLTGPNMAGKSVWMRQVATITLLAQAGSYVPARRARIGLVDAIYTRIGAVDDPAGGRSTFMVEMEETAGVLRGATDRSLVLLDELGRGTSTHDGMAIAWAVIEHLAAGPARPRAIVATHYHELAALGTAYPQLTLLRAAVEERADRVVFTHRIEPGAADRSFGIEVARLAGLPGPLLARAREVAEAIEPLSAEIAGRLGGLGRGGRAAGGSGGGRRAGSGREIA